jgi:hypothetical protein
MIRVRVLALAFLVLVPALATTLIRASLDDLIGKSTSIVRGRVINSSTASHGPLVYTHYKIQVTERWKGLTGDQVDVQVPGGSYNGVQQNIAGAPRLSTGAEYVFFLWTGPSGANHLLGLSQGVLDIAKDPDGNLIVVREASDALTLDSVTGRIASPDPVRMKLSDLSSRVASTVKGVDPK